MIHTARQQLQRDVVLLDEEVMLPTSLEQMLGRGTRKGEQYPDKSCFVVFDCFDGSLFEYFRKDLNRPSSDAWVVAPSNGFNRIGESECRSYGHGQGARVILPKHLLSAANAGGAPDFEHLLRDNYETPLYTPSLGGGEVELNQMENILRLSVDDTSTHQHTALATNAKGQVVTAHGGDTVHVAFSSPLRTIPHASATVTPSAAHSSRPLLLPDSIHGQ